MAVLGLCFCARAFSSCGKWGPLFIAVRGPFTVTASLVAEHRLQTRRLSSCGSRAQLLQGMWDPPRPVLEPASPALAGRFSTTAPPGKPRKLFSIPITRCLLTIFIDDMYASLVSLSWSTWLRTEPPKHNIHLCEGVGGWIKWVLERQPQYQLQVSLGQLLLQCVPWTTYVKIIYRACYMQIPRPKALSDTWQELKRYLLEGREGGIDGDPLS